MVVHLLKQYLGYMLVNLAPGFYMDIFLQPVLTFCTGKFSFLAMHQWKHCLDRGISIPRDMFIFIRFEGKIAKMAKTKFRFCKTFHAMQYISLILFPVKNSSGLANKAV